MKKLFILIVAITMALGLASMASAALTFQLDFGQDGTYENYYELLVGDVVSIDLYVSNVADPGLISMGFDIVYDPAQLAVVESGTDIDWANWYLGTGVMQYAPELEMKGGRMQPGLSGDLIKLATIEFECIALGLSELWLFDSDRGGSFDDFVLADGTVHDGEIKDGIMVAQINNVPIPAAVWLLGSGLLGLVGLRRKVRS